MKLLIKNGIGWFFLSGIMFVSCNIEFNCGDLAINPTFLGLDSSDIDTIIIRKYSPNNNYQNLLDTFIATHENSVYNSTNNSTTVFIDYYRQEHGIKVDYDWQIFIPAIQRTILITDIKSEKKTGERSRILEPINSYCFNRIFSINVNGQQVAMPYSPPYVVYINK